MAERLPPLLSKRSSRRWGLRKESLSMSKTKISRSVVHEVSADLKKALTSDPQALAAWEDITPLARNEWICWIESAKKAETRSRRIEWGCSSLKDGKRRPCCWPGCATANFQDGQTGHCDRGLESANFSFARDTIRIMKLRDRSPNGMAIDRNNRPASGARWGGAA